MTIVSEYEDPDWLVINTCGFIRDAKEESIEEILAALEKKEQGGIRRLAVFGCLIQRYRKDLEAAFAAADILWGVNDIESLADAIAADRPVAYPDRQLFLYSDKHPRATFTTANSSFIKLSEGCNMACSFCAIPQIRGPFRSRTIPSIVREAAGAEKEGRGGIEPHLPELHLFRQGPGADVAAAGPAEGAVRVGLPLAARPLPHARGDDPARFSTASRSPRCCPISICPFSTWRRGC